MKQTALEGTGSQVNGTRMNLEYKKNELEYQILCRVVTGFRENVSEAPGTE